MSYNYTSQSDFVHLVRNRSGILMHGMEAICSFNGWLILTTEKITETYCPDCNNFIQHS